MGLPWADDEAQDWEDVAGSGREDGQTDGPDRSGTPLPFGGPEVTAELYAAMCMEYKVWEEQAPGLGPMMMWHPPVEMLTARLCRMVDDAGCEKIGRHKGLEAEGSKRRCGPLRPRQLDRDWSSRYSTDAMIWGSSGRHPLTGPTGVPG